MAVVLAAGAIACGSSSSSTGSGLCDKYAGAASNLNTKLAGCGLPAITLQNSTTQACNSAISSCSSSDQQILSTFADCINGVPACPNQTSAAQQTFFNAIETCGTPLNNISAACQNAGTGGGTSGTGSCNFAGNGFCLDSVSSAACSSGGTFSTSACPTGNRVGTCTVTSGGQSIVVRLYSPTFTAALGQQACTAGQLGGAGTWVGG
jgi:hypothetical protein